MEIQVQELIDKIKKDGVDAAQGEAESIVSAAKAEADKIIAAAKAEADRLMQNARTENERTVKSGEDAIRQAGRNLLISFRESVAREVNALLNKNVSAVYSPENLAKFIIKAVEGWTANTDAEDLAVILNSEDLKAVEDIVIAGLCDKIKNGVTLKANDNFDGGFRISVNDGSAYYDYSTEAVVLMMSGYLSPRVTELLKEAE